VPRALFSAPDEDWPVYGSELARCAQAAGLDLELVTATDRPEAIDYVVYAPGGAVEDFSPLRRLKAVLSLWAGVEKIVGNPSIRVPLCRMVDPGMTAGMAEYVAAHVLRYHLGTDAHVLGQDGVWRGGLYPPLASERSVAVLGLGELGGHAAQVLAGLGFRVLGWSRRPRALTGVATHSGGAGLTAVLAQAEILVLLLPTTPATDNLLDGRRLAQLPTGARIVNPGRGTLIDEVALIAALDAGHVAHATLDVFRSEPLPPGHPFWAHPRVTVTPHVSAGTRPATAVPVILENIRRGEAGLPFLHVVDRAAGY
jgi:glyoxylate/hydroxypyruvate reductase A